MFRRISPSVKPESQQAAEQAAANIPTACGCNNCGRCGVKAERLFPPSMSERQIETPASSASFRSRSSDLGWRI